MHHGPSGSETIELACRLGELQITIRGPPEQATAFLVDITGRPNYRSLSPSAATDRSFELVSKGQPEPTVRARQETRAEIEASFERCPASLLAQSNRLSGSATSGADRVQRAWKAGQWARAVDQGRVRSPNRSPQLDLRARFYVVYKADTLEQPTIFRSATSYWRVVGDLQESTSISHAFPSEQEAKVYLAGAGVRDFTTKQ